MALYFVFFKDKLELTRKGQCERDVMMAHRHRYEILNSTTCRDLISNTNTFPLFPELILFQQVIIFHLFFKYK